MKKKLLLLIPLVVFFVLAGFFVVGLGLNPREVPSPLIGKPAPTFALPDLNEPEKTVTSKDFLGQVWLFNVWASWCVSCRAEHPLLVAYAKTNEVAIVGLNYKDKPADGKAWLRQYGDPYTVSVIDADGRVGIDYGVYGVPETFLIDKQGIIRYKQIGPITEEAMRKTIIPMIKELKQQ
ncbi:MAG: DsbE family thiol:disulfide interchange protein [Proteobacteria bacterium]|nr:DsbE family thiol:disulfide interchange protein [Pseudomonadota bacterium]MCL2308093.1 DsbE family thiol:disulfide interchange protein [Pseudomonadota bacterium]